MRSVPPLFPPPPPPLPGLPDVPAAAAAAAAAAAIAPDEAEKVLVEEVAGGGVETATECGGGVGEAGVEVCA